VVSTLMSSITTNRPSLQTGQQCWSSTVVMLGSESMGMGAAEAASRTRQWSSFCVRTRLAKKPKWRMRTKPGRQHVEQEATDELDRVEGHDLGAGVVRVVFPVKADMAVVQGAKPVIGDGDAMSVASEILEHASWSPQGRLYVNNPFELSGCFTHGLERRRLSQIAKLAREVKPTFAKRPCQGEKEEFAELTTEDLIRKEERILPASNPATAVGGEAAAGHNAMQVRMKQQPPTIP